MMNTKLLATTLSAMAIFSLSQCGPSTPTQTFNPKRGFVSVTTSTSAIGSMTTTTTIASASFYESFVPAGATVNTRTVGNCQVVFATFMPSDGSSTSPTMLSAGTITVMGGTASPFSLTPETSGSYNAGLMMGAIYNPGDVLTVSASGATVPAFSSMVTFPPSVTLSAPQIPGPGTPVAVSRATGLSLQWTAASSGNVYVSMFQGNNTRGTIIDCSFPANSGSATIATAVLSDLLDGEVSMTFGAGDRKTLMAGAYEIAVTAFNQPNNLTLSLAP